MNAKKIEKSEVGKFLEALRGKGYEIWIPSGENVAVEFRPLQEGTAPALDYANTRLSPKACVFPETERMFVFSADRQREDGFILKEVSQTDGEKLFFGIRPCDARSFCILDKVFLEQGAAKDPYYLGKRERTLFIGLGCNQPCATCFCHRTGGGPFSREGLDALMIDLGEAYLLEPVSERGGSLIEDMGFPEAGQEEIRQAEELAGKALDAMDDGPDPRPIKERPLMEVFDDPIWDTAHETCVKCGVCTYLCPTCSCFDIQDEVRGPCGIRERNWDTCMFPLTTLHASGHNPRPTGKERFRQRFMHKLKYFQDDFDTVMCVGCGRCIQFCPVNIDIREIIAALSA